MTTDIETARDATRDNRDDEHWVVKASRFVAEPMVRVTQDLAFGDHPRLRYDLYEPPPSTKAVATAHFIYGGSWETGERGCYRHVGAGLAMQGIRTVIADYRLHPEVSFPGFVDDMAQAYVERVRHRWNRFCDSIYVGSPALCL
jgi:acetyl esterase/lipase